MASFTGIGCMSGSSMDGLDMCCVEFTGDICSDLWGYRIIVAETISYTCEWTERLISAAKLSGLELLKLHTDYGIFIGKEVSNFIFKHKLDSVQFIASHGHSIFHQPEDGFTFQLGSGEASSTCFSVPFVCDFRSKDVSLGGQGAPLVPCGEKFLFRSNDVCINLGGIANVGIDGSAGYDICPCNIILNRLATIGDKKLYFDVDGEMAERGEIIPDVLSSLERLSYYKEKPPKSLWREYIESDVFPILDAKTYRIDDLLRTATEHIAAKVVETCLEPLSSGVRHVTICDKKDAFLRTRSCSQSSGPKPPSVLFTGGGALNKFLMQLIQTKLEGSDFEIDCVDENTINFKEALIFAFLGLRCLLGQENVFTEVTGSRADSISGSIHRPMRHSTAKQISLLHH